MAGQLIVVQKKIALNFSNQTGSTTNEYVHAAALNVIHARELIIQVRMSQRNIVAGATATLVVKGYYPDPDDGSDVVGADLLTLNLSTGISAVPGVGVVTQLNAIPAWIRILTRVVQPATAVACMFTFAIDAVTRE